MKSAIKVLSILTVLAMATVCYASENDAAYETPMGLTLQNMIMLQQSKHDKKLVKMREHFYYLPVEQAALLNKNEIKRD